MKKKIISLVLSISIIASASIGFSQKVQAFTFSTISKDTILTEAKAEKELDVILDHEDKDSTPDNFRMSNKKIEVNTCKLPDLRGLSELNISGSGQPTINGLKNMKKLLPNDKNVLVLDLRQESHLLVDGEGFNQKASEIINGQYSISWVKYYSNSANKGKSLSQIVQDEQERKKQLLVTNSIKLGPKDKVDKLKYTSIDKIKSVQTEEELVKTFGYNYYRIPVTDGCCPTDEDVDTFIKLVKSLPSNTWIHCHCLAGMGRTTTFMCMYDMMKNAKEVSCDDIINRQILIGGYDKVITESQSREKLLRAFYKYCSNNTDNFETRWTQR